MVIHVWIVVLVLVNIPPMVVYIPNVFVFKDTQECIAKVIGMRKKRLEWVILIHLLATLCSATSCNGGLCTAAQNTFVCLCPTGKFGDHCQVRSPSKLCIILTLCLVCRRLHEQSMFTNRTMWPSSKSLSMYVDYPLGRKKTRPDIFST